MIILYICHTIGTICNIEIGPQKSWATLNYILTIKIYYQPEYVI